MPSGSKLYELLGIENPKVVAEPATPDVSKKPVVISEATADADILANAIEDGEPAPKRGRKKK